MKNFYKWINKWENNYIEKKLKELEKDSFRRSMKIVEVIKQIQSPIIRMRMKIMAISELCLKISLKISIEMSLLIDKIFVLKHEF